MFGSGDALSSRDWVKWAILLCTIQGSINLQTPEFVKPHVPPGRQRRRLDKGALCVGAVRPQLLEDAVLQDVDVIDRQPDLGRDLVG